ncbi:MAG TPA: hypothetical protein VFX41_13675, partial [Actinomycetales bacterium]|nr:hypothetical protein [Actinomycetales bacterium]
KHVAGVAGEEAQNLGQEAKEQAKDLMEGFRGQVQEQSGAQKDRLVDMLRQFSNELQQMADSGGTSGLANDVVRQVSSRARDLYQGMENREPGELLDEVRRFARRKPGVFLFGAAAAGVLAGRLTRGVKSSTGSDGAEVGRYGTASLPATTTPPVSPPATTPPPPAGTGYPTSYPPASTAPGVGPGVVDPVEPGLPPRPYPQTGGTP